MTITCPTCGHTIDRTLGYFSGYRVTHGWLTLRCNKCCNQFEASLALEASGCAAGSGSGAPTAERLYFVTRSGSDDADGSS
jgi:hypothetical protein